MHARYLSNLRGIWYTTYSGKIHIFSKNYHTISGMAFYVLLLENNNGIATGV
jgi:hypothetical protein